MEASVAPNASAAYRPTGGASSASHANGSAASPSATTLTSATVATTAGTPSTNSAPGQTTTVAFALKGATAGAAGEDNRQDRREVAVLDPLANRIFRFAGNGVTTSKYSLVPFSLHFVLWKNLFEQFHRAANVYFLFIAILQVIPGLSPTGRWTTLIPLVMVLFISLIKDSWEDWKRRVADRTTNNRRTYVFRGGEWLQVAWRDVVVGDIVCVAKGEPFPCDLVALWTSNPDGLSFIETASLDGETNLKMRKAPMPIYAHFKRQPVDGPHKTPNPASFSGKIVCEMPNNSLYHFDGYVERLEGGKLQPRVPLSAENLLLRGAELRNTGFVLGAAVFTGDDTKLMRNATGKVHKRSNVDRVTNRQIFLVFIFQIFLSIVCSIGYRVAGGLSGEYYLGKESQNIDAEAATAFLTFMILLNSLIPISLYLTLEVVKLFQATLINNDLGMYSTSRDTPAQARSSRLNEELGQVSYIFSDKTGTLTCNQMEFKRFSTPRLDDAGIPMMTAYGTNEPNSSVSNDSMASPLMSAADPHVVPHSPRAGAGPIEFLDPRITKGAWRSQPNREDIRFLLQAMAVCHTVIPERDDATGRINYQASSPDEVCLVRAARRQGMELIERTETNMRVREFGTDYNWEVLSVIEFTSTRKRMSVIVRDPIGRLLLLTKGADSVVLERLKRTTAGDAGSGGQSALLHQTQELLGQFAADGLRTLVFAKLDLANEMYKRWRRRYDAANTSIHERTEKVEAVAEEIERDLDLIGTTAIEDRLQDCVPESIELLSKAGIKLWVLTGDKQETAINIGYSCQLLRPEMGLFTFENCNRRSLRHALEKYLTDVEAAAIESGQDIGLVIQGTMLEHILPVKDDPHANEYECDLFVSLATRCKAVICCRVSPLQKAQIVQAVKDRVGGAITLAIGDGANDVSMIQTAAVGVGISGLEGLQAARASDYSIAQFRYLVRLLLVHGRWSYRRIAKLVVFSFYKNMSLYLTQFWFCIHNMFTGQSLYDSWALAFYNLAFTAFPVMALAVFDRDVESQRLTHVSQFPELYKDGIENRFFNTYEFWTYTVNAVAHSLLLFYLPLLCLANMVDPTFGWDLGIACHGITAYTCVLLVVTIKCALETHTWTIINIALMLASIVFWFVWLLFYASIYEWFSYPDFARWHGADTRALSTAEFWFTIIVVTTVTVLRDFAVQYWRRNYRPTLSDCVQIFEVFGRDFNRNDVRRAAPWLFPKHEVKAFKPSLHDGLGNQRFSSGLVRSVSGTTSASLDDALGAPLLSSNASPSAMFVLGASSISLPRPVSGAGTSAAGGSAPPATSTVDERSPGRRKVRIADLLEEDI